MTRHNYTPEQKEFIRDNAFGVGNKELTQKFNDKFSTNLKTEQIKAFKKRNGISSGLTGHFKKGHTPINKGKSWDDYMSKDSQNKSRATCFNKGNIPHNRKSINNERVDKQNGYTYVKVKDGHGNANWRQKHILLWEKHNGKVPEGHRIIFLNQDKTDIRLDNLAMVTMAELIIMNNKGLIQKDGDLTKTGANIAKLINATWQATAKDSGDDIKKSPTPIGD